jgi:hypothetical protein
VATRQDVERAVAGTDPNAFLIICNGDGKTLGERPGSGHSASLIVLDLPEKIESGMHFAARPEQPAAITKALQRRSKKERARNRAASKRKQAASVPAVLPTRPARGLSRRPASPEPPAKSEPPAAPAETGEFHGIEVI